MFLGPSGDRDSAADFQTHVINPSQTRVLAFLNIVGTGVGG